MIALMMGSAAGCSSAAENQGEEMGQTKRSGSGPNEGYVTMEDGIRLFFQKAGGGGKTVLIPNAIYLSSDFKPLADGRTLIFYDLRNRGRSDQVSDGSKLKRGILQDVDDLEAIRRHFGINRADLIGHSYLGMMVILYAMKYPDHVGRIVQIGPLQPNPGKSYPAHLTGADATLREVSSRLAQLQKERSQLGPKEFCEKWWSVMRVIHVANPADADKLNHWGFCELPNELNLMKYWNESINPSIQNLNLQSEAVAKVTTPVLTIHGTKDRNAPYGGGREWALMLPDARLLSVENAAHAPWIEAPALVFASIKEFFGGRWPKASQKIQALDPRE